MEGPSLVADTASGTSAATNREHVQQIVRQNALWAMGAGAVPVPFVDVLGITAVQLRMVKQLCSAYAVAFDPNAARHIVTSLMASLGSVAVGTTLTGSLLKAVPFVGQTLGGVAVSVTAGAAVHAIGKVLVRHFEAAGTLASLDPVQLGGFLREEFAKAKRSLGELW